MSPDERFRIMIFLCSVAGVYLLAFLAVIGIIWRRFSGKSSATAVRPLQKWLERIFITLAVLGIFCIAYGYFIEPYRLTVRRFEIKSGKIKKPLRIAHISDLHSDPVPRLEEKLPPAIAGQKPDLILYTGDSINRPEGLKVFRRAITEIAKIAPTYVVKGNWDVWYWSSQNLFGETGANELDASVKKIDIKGEEIWLAGIPVEKESETDQLLQQIPPDKFSVFLFHYPDLIERVATHKTDLYVAGHTHGGQIALPLYGALVTFSKYGKRFEGGTYRVDDTNLNVNRGIGMEGGDAPRVRFWAAPEITVIDVVPE